MCSWFRRIGWLRKMNRQRGHRTPQKNSDELSIYRLDLSTHQSSWSWWSCVRLQDYGCWSNRCCARSATRRSLPGRDTSTSYVYTRPHTYTPDHIRLWSVQMGYTGFPGHLDRLIHAPQCRRGYRFISAVYVFWKWGSIEAHAFKE
jgi:hypothetical protein